MINVTVRTHFNPVEPPGSVWRCDDSAGVSILVNDKFVVQYKDEGYEDDFVICVTQGFIDAIKSFGDFSTIVGYESVNDAVDDYMPKVEITMLKDAIDISESV